MAMVWDPVTEKYVYKPDTPGGPSGGGAGAGTAGTIRPTEAGTPGSPGTPPIQQPAYAPVNPITLQPGTQPSHSWQVSGPGGMRITIGQAGQNASFSAPGVSGVYPNAAAMSGLAGAGPGGSADQFPPVTANEAAQGRFGLEQAGAAQNQDLQNRYQMLRQLGGNTGGLFGSAFGPLPAFQGAPLPGVAPVNVSAAQDAAFARAKDRIGQNLRASVDTYGDIAAAGGQNVVGGTNPQYQKQVMDLVGQAGGGLGDVIRDQSIEQARAGLEAAFANQQAGLAQRGQDIGVRGQDITLRGQDIAARNALYGLMFGPSSLGRLSY